VDLRSRFVQPIHDALAISGLKLVRDNVVIVISFPF